MPRSASLTLPPRPFRIGVGAAIAIAIAGLVAAILLAIAVAAADQSDARGSFVDVPHLLVMTATQAGLTTVLSLIVGVALAWALNRLRFPGRNLIVALFASAIVTPGIIVAFGLLAVWGRSGWVSESWRWLTGEQLTIPIFGLGGILAAHVILDAAFAARVLLARLDGLPAPRLKTGQSLGLTAWQRFRVIDWPTIRPSLPGLGAIIFLLAFTSFPIVLLLGGGPANQTFEVAIYTAAKLDFDLQAAVTLALVQIAVCSVIVLAASAFAPVAPGLSRSTPPLWHDRRGARIVQWTVLVLCVIGFALPLVAVLGGAISDDLPQVLARPSFWRSVLTSLSVASAAAVLTLALALTLSLARAATDHPLLRIGIGAPAYAYLAVPGVVLALGFFLLVRAIGVPPADFAPVVVVIANALLALPFAVATLGPAVDAVIRSRGKVIRSLSIESWRQFARIEWPLIGPEAGLVVALAFCFSLGDLGVIVFFGTQDFATLPLLLVRSLGAYRTDDAAVIAALMLLLTITAFALLPKLFERLAHARR